MMNSTTTLPITEARKQLFTLAQKVQQPSVYYTLTERGRARVILMSAEEFESWQETLEVVKDFPDLKKIMSELHSDIQSGKYQTYTNAANLPKHKHVLRQTQTKRRKRIT